MSSKDEREAREQFRGRYSIGPSRVLEEIERRVIGSVWGANGFTTVAQADRLAEELSLSRDTHLLDIGSGLGWPGLYLAQQMGCRVTITDLPMEALKSAAARAAEEGVDFAGAVVASGKNLPFVPASFDAVGHTDVLC